MAETDSTIAREGRVVREFIAGVFGESLREPAGPLPHRFIDPGAGYRDLLWDWDAHFCATGLQPWARRVGPYVRGCVRNFLDHQAEDGSVPYCLNARKTEPIRVANRPTESEQNSAKPLLAQMTRMACEYIGEDNWVAGVYPGLRASIEHWERTQMSEPGLLTFRSHRGSGADNHPAVYGRPFNSSADVFLNSLMVREYGAMAALAENMDAGDDVVHWCSRRDALAEAMQRMWDPIDGMFYNLDVQKRPIKRTNQPVDWAVPLKFRCWTAFMPLWAGVATDEQAERLVREHLTQPAEFWSGHGLRTMAAKEPAYCTFAGSNPSNWQGPIWVVSTWLTCEGLMRYGYGDEARRLAANLLRTLAEDIERNGCLHEYYHPETGEGLTHPGFLNWNTLAARLTDRYT
jgi:putative isomerase